MGEQIMHEVVSPSLHEKQKTNVDISSDKSVGVGIFRPAESSMISSNNEEGMMAIDEEDSFSSSSATAKPLLSLPKPPYTRPERKSSGMSGISVEEAIEQSDGTKPPSSQYKGVIAQPNGRWGAQIYEKHRRVWLGTFSEEKHAAKAYDTAAVKFRGDQAVTNFTPSGGADRETDFLRGRSKAEIVDMLRKHTFEEELQKAAKPSKSDAEVAGSNPGGRSEETSVYVRERLFEKAVTPSDVGKLNRLVIPKQHAQRCFPLAAAESEKGVLLNFHDGAGKTWRFRYSYWSSSQSYVLTKGWNRYVKEKRLQPGDTVVFERATGGSGQLYIAFRRRHQCSAAPTVSSAHRGCLLQPQFTGNRRWPHYFYSPPPVPQVSIGHCWIPSADNSFSTVSVHNGFPKMVFQHGFPLSVQNVLPSLKSVSIDGGSSPLELLSIGTDTAPSSLSVRLFGSNISGSSSVTLNLFPSSN